MAHQKPRTPLQDKPFYKALGARMLKRREEIGLTQTEIAAALRIAQTTYAAYENGRHRVPVVLLQPVADVLRTDVGYLLGSAPVTKSGRAKRR